MKVTGLVLSLVGAATAACGGPSGGAAGSGSAAASNAEIASSSAVASSSAAAASGASVWQVALEAKGSLTLDELDGGVWIMDASGKHAASAKDGATALDDQKLPSGLPSDLVRMQYAGGRLPDSVWLSVSRPPEEGKKKGPTPFFRLTKSTLKSIADDWQPLVFPWTKRRVLTMSTSSGKLKIKVVEPFTKTVLADQPSRFVPDEECGKSLKLAEAAALANGDVVAAGRCSMGSAKKPTYVVVRWSPNAAPSADAPAVAPSATVAPASSAEPATPAEPASSADAGAGDKEEADADEKKGVPMKLVTVATDKAQHRSLAIASSGEVFVGAVVGGPEESRVYSVGPDAAAPVTLPKLDGPLLHIAVTEAGDLWVLTARAAHKKPRAGEWETFAAPEGTTFERIESAADTVWVAATRGGGGVLLRFAPGAPAGSAAPTRWD